MKTLPPRPHLDHLRKEAKQSLSVMRAHAPAARLGDAQLVLARDYGFSSWRALKAEVDRRSTGFTDPPAAAAVGMMGDAVPARAGRVVRRLAILPDSNMAESALFRLASLGMAATQMAVAVMMHFHLA